MDKPTLEEQIAVSKMSEEDLIKALLPQGLLGKISFWLHNHCILIWRIIYWNWFNVFTGDKSFVKFARHRFREWKEDTEVEGEHRD